MSDLTDKVNPMNDTTTPICEYGTDCDAPATTLVYQVLIPLDGSDPVIHNYADPACDKHADFFERADDWVDTERGVAYRYVRVAIDKINRTKVPA